MDADFLEGHILVSLHQQGRWSKACAAGVRFALHPESESAGSVDPMGVTIVRISLKAAKDDQVRVALLVRTNFQS